MLIGVKPSSLRAGHKSTAQQVSKSSAHQPGQPLPGVGDVGQSGVGGFPEVEKFLMICECLEPYYSKPIFCSSSA